MASNWQSQRCFDGERVFKLFCSCRDQSNEIAIDCYIDAYEELCKLFQLFGTLFSFVVSDVTDKIATLRGYLQSHNSEKYKTVKSMLNFETSIEATENGKTPSGTQTLLILHRAMQFISALILKLRDTDNSDKFSSHAGAAYEATLARHHPWLIKKAVHMALYMLPTRHVILKQMGVEDNEKRVPGMTNLVHELNIIFDIIEGLYAKHNLLEIA